MLIAPLSGVLVEDFREENEVGPPPARELRGVPLESFGGTEEVDVLQCSMWCSA